MNFKSILLVCVSLLISSKLFSYKITWGESQKTGSPASRMISSKGKNVFVVKPKTYKTSVDYSSNFVLTATGALISTFSDKETKYKDCIVLGGRFYIITTLENDNIADYFVQEYNEYMLPVGEDKKIHSFTKTGKESNSAIKLQTSDDGNLLFMYWNTIDINKTERTTKNYFKVFDLSFEELESFEFELTSEKVLMNADQLYITNHGDLIFGINEYNFKFQLLKMHIYQVLDGNIQEVECDFEEYEVRTLKITSDNKNKIVLAGTLGLNNKNYINGIYNIIIDYKNPDIHVSTFKNFSKEFTLSTLDSEELALTNSPTLILESFHTNIVMRDLQIDSEGNVYGSMEEFYVNRFSGIVFEYGNIIAFKINTKGEFAWINVFKKDQYGLNISDICGYFSFLDNGSYNFILNEDAQNFDNEGNKKLLNYIKTSYNTKMKNLQIVLFSLNKVNGNMSQEIIMSNEELGAYFHPRISVFSKEENGAILYANKGGIEKYGLLKYEN